MSIVKKISGYNSESFTLKDKCSNRNTTIKQIIMDQKVVVGVGNIYASEALHRAGIKPQSKANKLSKKRCEKLVDAIQWVLEAAINSGGCERFGIAC